MNEEKEILERLLRSVDQARSLAADRGYQQVAACLGTYRTTFYFGWICLFVTKDGELSVESRPIHYLHCENCGIKCTCGEPKMAGWYQIPNCEKVCEKFADFSTPIEEIVTEMNSEWRKFHSSPFRYELIGDGVIKVTPGLEAARVCEPHELPEVEVRDMYRRYWTDLGPLTVADLL
jgi:hypothetical protein